MKLKELGEFAFIERFSKLFDISSDHNLIGIGDDCAVIPIDDEKSQLITTDTLVDSIHFISAKTKPVDLGYKALAVNLSDIAAMGGTPKYAFLCLTTPQDIEVEWYDKFFEGFKLCCDQFEVKLLGGDMTKTSSHLVITVTVLGIAAKDKIKYRSTAKPGDLICVTDKIGDSVGGLYAYLNELPSSEAVEYLKNAHFKPHPHIAEGKWLAAQSGVHAMLDISDGIESDIHRIMEKSGCGAEIELTRLPLSDWFIKVAKEQNWQMWELAFTGGEDYCLMLTVDPQDYDDLAEKYALLFDKNLSRIGHITDQNELKLTFEGKNHQIRKRGYNHFRKSH